MGGGGVISHFLTAILKSEYITICDIIYSKLKFNYFWAMRVLVTPNCLVEFK